MALAKASSVCRSNTVISSAGHAQKGSRFIFHTKAQWAKTTMQIDPRPFVGYTMCRASERKRRERVDFARVTGPPAEVGPRNARK